ncbi:hypothetical protein PANG_00053 [Paenibacillus phage PG1]|uniref:hypothetical protein n=1 Tax=Paenibacillus phage PG1 TaxID=754053 RepID=UPI0003428CA9|nr:hypothetical protein PANG_00053 [Paenibacillus phage PG1]AGN33772.1 hypothetical protein PANG_00053 [Paenibacillus phage PG1]
MGVRVDMNNQMDKAKFLEWLDGEDAAVLWEGPDGLMKYDMLVETINSGEFDPDTPPVPTIKPGDKVRHSDLGEGTAVGYGEQVIEISTIRGNFDVSVKDLEVVE